MADYIYPNDGKLHVRYHELLRCTPASIDSVVAERLNPELKYTNEALAFGTDRHKMWAEESRMTGRTPECFQVLKDDGFSLKLDHIEKELVSEVAPGIVLHSRPDAVAIAEMTLIDYKCLTDREASGKYLKSRQGLCYAYQLMLHSIHIQHIKYLFEYWDKDRTSIVGYGIRGMHVSVMEAAKMRDWIIARASLLLTALEDRKAAA